MRKTLFTGATLLSLGAWAGFDHFGRAPVDPCDVTPEIHACAMFLQPEWQRRSVHAGRPALPATPAESAESASRAASAHVSDEGALLSPPIEVSSDGV